MKSAPIIAGAAMLVVLATLATAKAPNPPTTVLPLDFRGVRVLEARSTNMVQIEVSNAAPKASYQDSEAAHVTVRRDGDRLIIDGKLDGDTLDLVVPPTIERFVVGSATIESKVPMRQVEVLSDRIFSWKGDVGRLEIRDTSVHGHHDGAAAAAAAAASDDDCECGEDAVRLSVDGGKVGDLRVHSQRAMLQLDDADSIGVAYAWLGPKGSVTINTARRFGQVHVMAEGAPEPP
jgi:hypothetical protein